jgi:hypothetical protein
MSRMEKRYVITYDLYPKHVLEPNGLFEWEKVTDVECYCGHKQNSHLDGIEICLKGLCICEKLSG